MTQLSPVLMGLIGGNVLLALACVYLFARISKLTKGADGASLEEKIKNVLSQNVAYGQHFTKVDGRLASLEDRMKRVVRNVKTNRFDPFEGAGGNTGKQSFAVALLDDEGNGAVISSLHAHDKVRVFAKPISNFNSPHELSEEEKRVIAEAK